MRPLMFLVRSAGFKRFGAVLLRWMFVHSVHAKLRVVDVDDGLLSEVERGDVMMDDAADMVCMWLMGEACDG